MSPVWDRITLASGADGLALTHHVTTYDPETDVPTDGEWAVTHEPSDKTVNRCNFRTLHAAANMALRIAPMADWQAAEETLHGQIDSVAIRHAEAHAHEIDATYPAGNVFTANGLDDVAMVDEDGTLRRYLSQAPEVQWTKNDDGQRVCASCGEPPMLTFEGEHA